jgi:hypothetical protein
MNWSAALKRFRDCHGGEPGSQQRAELAPWTRGTHVPPDRAGEQTEVPHIEGCPIGTRVAMSNALSPAEGPSRTPIADREEACASG